MAVLAWLFQWLEDRSSTYLVLATPVCEHKGNRGEQVSVLCEVTAQDGSSLRACHVTLVL